MAGCKVFHYVVVNGNDLLVYAPVVFPHSPTPIDLIMPAYRFAMHHGAVETEELGFMKLLDDAEAVDFAQRIIHDMPNKDRTQGVGRSVAITDGKRAVGRISCDAELKA